jgi:carboxyl-terminal processing protease
MRRAPLLLLGAAIGATLTLTVATTYPRVALNGADAKSSIAAKSFRPLELFARAFDHVRAHYVERPSDARLIEGAANGLLADLRDSYYLDAKTYADAKARGEACTGSGCGTGAVGVAFTVVDGLPKVMTAIDGMPAAKAGIMAGDVIARLDDDSIQGFTSHQVSEKMRGRPGTTIRLSIARPGRGQPLEIPIVRDITPSRSIVSRTDADDIGYIRVAQFNENTAAQLKKALGEIATRTAPEGLKGYVLDLRNNPGGLMEAAMAFADAFLEDGEIVSIHRRDIQDVERIRAKAGDLVAGKPLVVLINGGSASLAEVVAAALQDQRRATLVGTRSFGKGSVGAIIPLAPGNGAIQLTTGQFVTPLGRLIEGKGVAPDVEVPQDVPDDLKSDIKLAQSAQRPLQSYIPPDPKDDKALNAAYDLLRRGRAEAAARPARSSSPN